ncbi:hypothetical protein A4X17_05615 [Plantibacter sp. H53]|uniref:hypothetical protein n=1 Tax=Plantibacter sp. H53 TaxID=1827323 RepID=UPI0007D9625B|nr:hypothetical protein [Plantibacter sp. H53]OAN29058.1 hypothetical protein A4X17_05615 [Plantibacter sp. H53]
MIKNYRTTQVLAIIFGITTVVLFFMNRQGTLLYYMSEGGAWLITIGNFALLCISLALFIAARATRNRPRGRELDTLHSFADRKVYETMARPEAIPVPSQLLEQLAQPLDTADIPIAGGVGLDHVRSGETVKLTAIDDGTRFVVVEVDEVTSELVRVHRSSF